jgi:hypothetical protein
MKRLKTILLSVSIVSACVLWFTRSESLPSLSAFALSDNALYYRLMHLSASWFFLINAFSKRYVTEFLLALGMGLILSFDMYNYKVLHFIFTGATLALACFTLVYKKKGFEFKQYMFISVGASIIFVLGFFTEALHLLLAEIIAMTVIINGKLLEVWEEKE